MRIWNDLGRSWAASAPVAGPDPGIAGFLLHKFEYDRRRQVPVKENDNRLLNSPVASRVIYKRSNNGRLKLTGQPMDWYRTHLDTIGE